MGKGFFYLATPYTHYPDGREAAFREACRVAAAVLRAGVAVYSPIAHTHPIATHGIGLDPTDHDLWQKVDGAMMDAAIGIIVVKMSGGETSRGVQAEIERFAAAGKPILYIDPGLTILGGITKELREAA